ncbi:MAG TPA: ATP-dependent sacrificial sulfur transferase LarE [Bacteroidales bacterium]|nr:ATP-dependent sacrificial sulfur transferase LarE [Bacteroidales bacterium]
MAGDKETKLRTILNDLSSFIVAFSGGVDSSFLAYRAHHLKNRDVLAVTIRTPYIPAIEISDAIEFTSRHGIQHKILDLSFPEIVRNNPLERCYLCKKTLFNELKRFAFNNNFRHVVDGTNADDTGEYRPGLKALQELGIRSPLLEAGLTKEEIRKLAKEDGLEIWGKAAMACLLTRIPYNTEIREEDLRMIEAAESLLFKNGYPGTRVRIHGDLARIECMPGYFDKMIQKTEREKIITGLKHIGFRYISLDLEGYRTGSSNPQIQ